MDKIKELLIELFENKALNKMIMSDLRHKSTEYKKVAIRPVILQGFLWYQAEYHYNKKVTHINLNSENALDLCLKLIQNDFKQVNISTNTQDIQIIAAKPDNPRITRKTMESNNCTKPSLEHNQLKKYIIPDGVPCDFLIRLGVMDENGKVFQKHYGKFRQINRFLEIVKDSEDSLPSQKILKIIDFGCGKAYLTFALYHYLKVLHNRNVEIIGLDLKDDVIDFCNKVANDLNYDELTFLRGDIADYTQDNADMVVTLHACDTATDYALINATKWSTKVILSVPCCQHELFKQIDNDLHKPLYKHGILKDRFTEILTDGMRALALEAKGYEVSMIEFTSLEHTARNIMIKAILLNQDDVSSTEPVSKKAAKAKQEYSSLKEFYKINPTIDELFY